MSVMRKRACRFESCLGSKEVLEMNMRSFGKCEQCGRHDMLHCFWYNGIELTPWYLCDKCMEDFDDAMESYRDVYDDYE